MSPQMPYIQQRLYSLMIRVNMARCLHFYRKTGRNNTIAKFNPFEKKTTRNSTSRPRMHCTQGSNINYCYTSKEKNSRRSDCWDGNGCVCVFVHVWVCFWMCLRVCVWFGRGWIERHSVKRSFRNTLPQWRWCKLLIDMHFSTETRAINLSATH